MPEPITTVLGFDFGTHWIGVAVGQTLTCQARPLHAIKAGDWDAIAKLIEQWQPERFIVGLPLNMQDQKQAMSERAERFGRQLEGRFGIPAEMVDERLTTREAYLMAIERHQKKSKTDIDSLSAMLITESWLRQQA
jgi:putative Holliday junction resolvase